MTDLIDNKLPLTDWPHTPADYAEWERQQKVAVRVLKRLGCDDLIAVLGIEDVMA